MNIDKEFINTLDSIFSITDAYTWEGHSSLTLEKVDIKNDCVLITLNVKGVSTVEHSGDIRGIIDQVKELQNFTSNEYKLIESTCKITEENHNNDEDYNVYVRGIVIIKILKK